MARKSDLPIELVEEEILSRLPLLSLGAVRSACKKWDSLSKNPLFFGKAEARNKQFEFVGGFMMKDYRVCSLKLNLRNDGDSVDLSIKQVSIFDQIEISQVFHCDGLLLCVLKDKSGLVLWNPYLGQTRLVQLQPRRREFDSYDVYGLGYDKDRNHKILRIFFDSRNVLGYEVYDLTSDSWKVAYVTADWHMFPHERGVSLQGNTYFLPRVEWSKHVLLCFDFTTETFGPYMPLPCGEEIMSLSCVRDEQLALLHNQYDCMSHVVEIWVTDKINPNAVLWSKFLSQGPDFPVNYLAGSFLIDEEKKLAVIFDLHHQPERNRTSLYGRGRTCFCQTAHIIGQDGYYKSLYIGEAPKTLEKPDETGYTAPMYCHPLLCSSPYVPSLVQLHINQPSKGRESDASY